MSYPGARDGALRLGGGYFEADFADFIAWRDFGFPGEPIENCFAMAALRSADGAFLLGEMAPHTANAGKIYFPAGTPDPNDVFDGRVDLDASARRELMEETGVSADEAAVQGGWTVVFAEPARGLHEGHDAADAGGRGEGADRRFPGARFAGGTHAHAYRAAPGRHRSRTNAGSRRRLHRRGARVRRTRSVARAS